MKSGNCVNCDDGQAMYCASCFGAALLKTERDVLKKAQKKKSSEVKRR